MVVYTAAQNQISDWGEKGQYDIPIFLIDLDRRPDLGKQFNIIRVPALLIVDQEGKVIYIQKESISDTAPLDLQTLDLTIKELFHGK